MLGGKQERVMAELAGPLQVIKIAIQTARIAYPDYERETGTKDTSNNKCYRSGCLGLIV